MLRNMPNTKVLQTFECAARLGSFTLAAKELFVSQSAISRQIKGLEETLGFEIFIRDNNRLELTENGQEFYQAVSKALTDVSITLEKLRRGETRRRLYIAVPPTFASRWLAPRLLMFKKKHSVSLTISIHKNFNYSPLGKFDTQVAYGSKELNTIGGTILFPESIVPACSPELKQKILSQGNLGDIPILHTLSEDSRLPYWEQWLDRRETSVIKPTIDQLGDGIELSTLDQTIISAISGLGIAMVDCNIASSVIDNGLLEIIGEPVSTDYGYWIFPPNALRGENDPSNQFYKWLQKEAKQNLGSFPVVRK